MSAEDLHRHLLQERIHNQHYNQRQGHKTSLPSYSSAGGSHGSPIPSSTRSYAARFTQQNQHQHYHSNTTPPPLRMNYKNNREEGRRTHRGGGGPSRQGQQATAPLAVAFSPSSSSSSISFQEGRQISQNLDNMSYEQILEMCDRVGTVKVGVPEHILKKIPVIVVRQEGCSATDPCSICLDHFELGHRMKILPCRHAFHESCVDQWLREHKHCPVCKVDVALKGGSVGDVLTQLLGLVEHCP